MITPFARPLATSQNPKANSKICTGPVNQYRDCQGAVLSVVEIRHWPTFGHVSHSAIAVCRPHPRLVYGFPDLADMRHRSLAVVVRITRAYDPRICPASQLDI